MSPLRRLAVTKPRTSGVREHPPILDAMKPHLFPPLASLHQTVSTLAMLTSALLLSTVSGQTPGAWFAPLPPVNHLSNVINGSTHYAVGNEGTLLHSPSATAVAPEIVVEQPAGIPLTDGSSTVSLAVVSNTSKTFTIRNTGTADLTGLALTIDGPQAGSFVLGALGATTLAPGASTTFTVSRPLIVTLPAGYQTATLHIASNDADEAPFDIPLTYSYLVRWNWRKIHFNSTSKYDVSSDTSDPDGDGSSNLLEFATHSSPTMTNAAPGQMAVNGGNLEFTYTRANVALGECTFTVQWNDLLAEAGWSSVGVVEAVQSDDGVTQVVKATIPAGSGTARFVRLNVTGVPDYIEDEGGGLGDPPPPPD